jgi:energy-converting hydrogenase A subunit M
VGHIELLGLEEQDRAVTEVEVDEVLRLCWLLDISCSYAIGQRPHTVSDEASEITAYDAVPCCAFAVIELWDC